MRLTLVITGQIDDILHLRRWGRSPESACNKSWYQWRWSKLFAVRACLQARISELPKHRPPERFETRLNIEAHPKSKRSRSPMLFLGKENSGEVRGRGFVAMSRERVGSTRVTRALGKPRCLGMRYLQEAWDHCLRTKVQRSWTLTPHLLHHILLQSVSGHYLGRQHFFPPCHRVTITPHMGFTQSMV